jgi:hypothetical protein
VTDLSGTWLGSYWQNGKQVRFEFALIHSGNTISGNILDDCYLGEANITGEVIARQIQFSKRYVSVLQPPSIIPGPFQTMEIQCKAIGPFPTKFSVLVLLHLALGKPTAIATI